MMNLVKELSPILTVSEQHVAQRKRLYSEQSTAIGVHSYRQPKRNKQEKVVRFSNTDIVTVFNSIPEDVTSTLWYQEVEYQRIRQEAKETIAIFQKCGFSFDSVRDCETYCMIGLEGVFAATVFQILRHRNQKIVKSVLCQQQILRQAGRTDEEALRLSSIVISLFDKQKAWTRAHSERLVI